MAQGQETAEKYPGMLYYDALIGSQVNVMPPFTPEGFVAMTGLARDERDGRQIAARFAGDEHDLAALRATVASIPGTVELIQLTNRGEANEAQENLGRAIGAVLSRQIVREGSVCTVSNEIARTSTRPDIISPEAQRILRDTDPMGGVMEELFGGRGRAGMPAAAFGRLPVIIVVSRGYNGWPGGGLDAGSPFRR